VLRRERVAHQWHARGGQRFDPKTQRACIELGAAPRAFPSAVSQTESNVRSPAFVIRIPSDSTAAQANHQRHPAALRRIVLTLIHAIHMTCRLLQRQSRLSPPCTGWPPPSLSTLDPILLRTAVRQGAASRRCWAVVQRRRPGPRRRCRHHGAVMGGQAPPDAATRARPGRPASSRRSPGCPDAGHAGRRPVRVLCPPCGRPSNRSRGRPVSTRPVSTRPVPSRCPDRRASGVRGSAAALSAPPWTLERLSAAGRPVGRTGFEVPPWSAGGVVAYPHTGLTGRDGAGLAMGGSHEGRRQTWAAASHAHRLRRRLAA
jgi:hypothetical protein